MFRTVLLSIISSSLHTQQCYMSNKYADSLRAGSGRNWFGSAHHQFRPDPARKLSANLYNIYQCCVLRTRDDGQKNCPKHEGFYSKNKFEKLMHLVCFIKWIVMFLSVNPLIWYYCLFAWTIYSLRHIRILYLIT